MVIKINNKINDDTKYFRLQTKKRSDKNVRTCFSFRMNGLNPEKMEA